MQDNIFRTTTRVLYGDTDAGGVDMVDPATGQAVAGGSSGGTTGGSGECH